MPRQPVFAQVKNADTETYVEGVLKPWDAGRSMQAPLCLGLGAISEGEILPEPATVASEAAGAMLSLRFASPRVGPDTGHCLVGRVPDQVR